MKRRQYFCVAGYERKTDAEHDARGVPRTYGKAKVKRDGRGYKVCYTVKKHGKGVPASLRGAKREPPPVYHPRMGPPPGVPLRGARRRRKKRK